MIKKLIRKLIRWAFAGEHGSFMVGVGADARIDRSDAEEILIRGVSTPEGRKVIINTIKTAKTNREL